MAECLAWRRDWTPERLKTENHRMIGYVRKSVAERDRLYEETRRRISEILARLPKEDADFLRTRLA